MSFDFIDNKSSQVPNNVPLQNQNINQRSVQKAVEVLPDITSNSTDGFKPKFTISNDSSSNLVPVVNEVPTGNSTKTEKKRRKRTTKKDSGEIIRAENSETVSGQVEDTPTIYSYTNTTNMLHETIGQIDTVNAELMKEFDTVRHARTLKNKYNTLNGLSENIGSLLSNRIAAIKEINSTISKSNDMDYKRNKDKAAAQASVDDDQYIANLYKSFLQNPQANPTLPQMPQIDPSIFGSGIVRADIGGSVSPGQNVDTSYLNYLSNLNPEQNLMRYEDNPNVKQVVVFDAATGNKFFQMMDMSTGQVIPNVPVYDEMFMEDTTLDLQKGIAKNINLNETFPIVQINNDVTSQY